MIKRLRCSNCGHIFNAAIGDEIAYVCCPHCRYDIDVVKNEIKNIRSDKMDNEVLAKISKEELEERIELNVEDKALTELIENLFSKAVKLRKKDEEWLRKIRNKYDIKVNPLKLNSETGEIFKEE